MRSVRKLPWLTLVISHVVVELPELAKVKDSDEPVSPGAARGPVNASEYMVLEKKSVESPRKRTYLPIVANVVRDLTPDSNGVRT